MHRIEIPRQPNPKKTQMALDYSGRAKELASYLDRPLEPRQREQVLARISYLLFLAGKSWKSLGLNPRQIRTKLKEQARQHAMEILKDLRKRWKEVESDHYRHDARGEDVHYLRVQLARAGCPLSAIGTTKQELEIFARGIPSWEYAKQLIAQRQEKTEEADRLLLQILRNLDCYPQSRIGVSKRTVRVVAREATRALLKKTTAQARKIQKESEPAWENRRAIRMAVDLTRAYLRTLDIPPERIGSNKQQIRELIYPPAYHRAKAEEELVHLRALPSKRNASRVRRHSRHARCSLKELGTNEAELRAAAEKSE